MRGISYNTLVKKKACLIIEGETDSFRCFLEKISEEEYVHQTEGLYLSFTSKDAEYRLLSRYPDHETELVFSSVPGAFVRSAEGELELAVKVLAIERHDDIVCIRYLIGNDARCLTIMF